MRSTLRSKIMLILIATVLLVPLMMVPFQSEKQLEQFHNRKLSHLPAEALFFKEPDKYFHHFELWLNDRIGFNRQVVDIFKKFIFYILHDSPSPNVSVNGQFAFLNSHSADPNTKFSAFIHTCPDPIAYDKIFYQLESAMLSIATYVRSKGINPVFVVAPSKPALYPEQLPLSVPKSIRSNCFKLQQSNNPLVLLSKKYPQLVVYPFLESLALRNTEQFYPPENFHFNGMSAHVLSKVFFAKLERADPHLSNVSATLRSREGDLTVTLGFQWSVKIWQFDYAPYGVRRVWPHEQELVERNFLRTDELKKWYPRLLDFSFWLVDKPITDKTALIFSNSFGAFTAPHLARGYKKLFHLNISNVDDENIKFLFESIIARYKPEEFLFVFHDAPYFSNKLEKLSKRLR